MQPTNDRKSINDYRHEPTLSIFVSIKEEYFFFSTLESNHIKFMTYQLVKRKEFPSLLIRNMATTNIKNHGSYTDFINYILKKKVKNRTFLVSVDVTSHGKYNIKRVVCRAYTNFYKDNSPIPTYYLREILRLILKENYFHFNGKHHRTAMGMHKDSSFLANIFMAYIETQILSYS